MPTANYDYTRSTLALAMDAQFLQNPPSGANEWFHQGAIDLPDPDHYTSQA